ncbi:MAG: hypothetical protein ABSF98_07025 [Bryobacteraceae bacterium]|jgi:hypothetical protein
MKYSARIVFLALLAAAMLAAQGHGFGGGPDRGFGFGMIGPAGRTPVTGAPYSAVEVRVYAQTLANGNRIQRQEQTSIWRDSQGRVRTETVSRLNHTTITVFDPVAGNVVRLDTQRQTAMVSTVKGRTWQDAARPHGAGNQPAVAKEDLGPSTINGRPASATRMTRTIPVGAIGNQQAITVTHTVWMSPDLKVPLQIVSDDPRFGTTTTTLTNIVQAEPDAALFQIPSGYAVRTMPTGRGPHGGAPVQSE